MSARLERERRSAKISAGKTIFWHSVVSWKYCNSHRWEGFSLEPRAFSTFRFLGGRFGAENVYPGTRGLLETLVFFTDISVSDIFGFVHGFGCGLFLALSSCGRFVRRIASCGVDV